MGTTTQEQEPQIFDQEAVRSVEANGRSWLNRHPKVKIAGAVVALTGAAIGGVRWGLDAWERQNQSEVSKKIEGILGERAANGVGVTVDVYGSDSDKLSLGCENVSGLREKTDDEDEQLLTFGLRDGMGTTTLILPRAAQVDLEGIEIVRAGETEIDISTKHAFNEFLTGDQFKGWCQTAFGKEG